MRAGRKPGVCGLPPAPASAGEWDSEAAHSSKIPATFRAKNVHEAGFLEQSRTLSRSVFFGKYTTGDGEKRELFVTEL